MRAYKLYSQKDEDGYLNPFNSFYAEPESRALKVHLTDKHRSVTVRVKMGDKAGVVAGQVIDADSGAAAKALLVFVDQEIKMEMAIKYWQMASIAYFCHRERI